MAKMLLTKRSAGGYHNWDEFEFRHAWGKKPSIVIPERQGNIVPLIVLDEIHKERFWKRNLKGLFDTQKYPCDFLIVRDGVPWLPVEAKISDVTPSASWKKYAAMLPCKQALQIVRQPHWAVHEFGDAKVLVAGAAEALGYFA